MAFEVISNLSFECETRTVCRLDRWLFKVPSRGQEARVNVEHLGISHNTFSVHRVPSWQAALSKFQYRTQFTQSGVIFTQVSPSSSLKKYIKITKAHFRKVSYSCREKSNEKGRQKQNHFQIINNHLPTRNLWQTLGSTLHTLPGNCRATFEKNNYLITHISKVDLIPTVGSIKVYFSFFLY